MKTRIAKTFSAKPSDVQRKWYLLDAKGQVVGRVAEKAAVILRGKNKPLFTPHIDTGDFVIITNAKDSVFTGKKEEQKIYMSYAGYIGREKRESAKARRVRRPELILQSAVKGMVPHNRLGRAMMKKLFVYAGPEHPHVAQAPEPVALTCAAPSKSKAKAAA